MENKPVVSIIVPLYNREEVIIDTLESISSQTYTDWECILIDDHSTDDTYKIVEAYCKKDARFTLEYRPENRQKGANACRNYGYEKSSGEFINWFDSDDIMTPYFLKHKIQRLLENDSLDFCACFSQVFYSTIGDSQELEKPEILRSENYLEDYMFHGLFFDTAAPLWRKSFLSKNRLVFDETLQRSQERDFHFSALFYNPIFEYLNEPLFYTRRGVQNSITKNFSKSLQLQESNFKYFDKAFTAIDSLNESESKVKLLQYIYYRQLVHFYNFFQIENYTFFIRVKLFQKHASKISKYISKTDLSEAICFKAFLGLFLLLVLRKGYKYLYYPQFNYRNYEN